LPDVPHHVVLRGNNRRRLFSYKHEYQRFLWDVLRAQRLWSCLVHAITLMTNHVHMIVRPPTDTALSFFIKSFAQRYAQLRNQRRQASGRLFEERFWARPILTERQLAITTAYIELNPVRGGLVESPTDSPWSSFALHVGQPDRAEIPRALWTPSEWYQDLGRNDAERSAAYAEWVAECRARDERPEDADRIAILEAASNPQYSHRLLRPDGTSAREPEHFYVSGQTLFDSEGL
jgi:putative transposase